MPERYSSEKAWEESQAIRNASEGQAKRDRRRVTARDYEIASATFDEMRKLSPQGAEGFIRQLAAAYEHSQRLGPERRKLLETIDAEVMQRLNDRVKTARAVLQDRWSDLKPSHQEKMEEALAMSHDFLRQVRDEVVHDPRVEEAFAEDPELLDEIFGDAAINENARMLANMLGIEG